MRRNLLRGVTALTMTMSLAVLLTAIQPRPVFAASIGSLPQIPLCSMVNFPCKGSCGLWDLFGYVCQFGMPAGVLPAGIGCYCM